MVRPSHVQAVMQHSFHLIFLRGTSPHVPMHRHYIRRLCQRCSKLLLWWAPNKVPKTAKRVSGGNSSLSSSSRSAQIWKQEIISVDLVTEKFPNKRSSTRKRAILDRCARPPWAREVGGTLGRVLLLFLRTHVKQHHSDCTRRAIKRSG